MTPEPYTKKLATIVGRDYEKEVIRKAVEGTGRPIVIVEGVGGIGKTALFEQAEEYVARDNVLWPPLIDFYDTAMHSSQGLEAVIALGLDPQKKHFTDYWRLRERDPQSNLWDAFLDGYTRVTESTRVVLRFDTAERLEYEREPEAVRRALGFEDFESYEAPSLSWLLRVGSLPNTAVLIAARPTSTGYLKQQLSSQYPDMIWFLDLAGLKYEETEAYVIETEIGAKIYSEAPGAIRRVHELSKGRPILISLTLDWLRRGEWNRRMLDEIDGSDFERALVEQISNLDTPLDKAVRYAALCRKGYNADLLALLMRVDHETAQSLVDELKDLTFVKVPRRTTGDGYDEGNDDGEFYHNHLFFLHDEMYDLVEEYVWRPLWSGYEEQERLDQLVIKWYDDLIERLAQRIRTHPSWRDRGRLRRKQQLLYTERLYYQLDRDPKAGYREYSHRTEEAIVAREIEWDTWLRNELFGFIAHRASRWQRAGVKLVSEMEYDARRFWINRFTAREDYDRAIAIAEQLLESEKQPDEPALFSGGLRIALATAQAYKGKQPFVEAALSNFAESIQMVKSYVGSGHDSWLSRYLLGTAHLYRGVALRSTHPLAEAAQAYDDAKTQFQVINYLPGIAESQNNLAFVRARLGMLSQAEDDCDGALKIRQEIGDEYVIGLSLNTKGIIEERLGKPVTAIRYSEEAKEIFTEIHKQRGIIMAAINLGRAYRRKGRSPDWGQQDRDFNKGAKHLRDALRRQRAVGGNVEAYYQIQAHNEMGCLYRDWASVLLDRDPSGLEGAKKLTTAEKNLKEAIRLARGENAAAPQDAFQYSDCLEDLARVYYLWSRVEPSNKDHWLSQMTPLLDEAGIIARENIGEKEYQLVLGKVYFQLARQALTANQPNRAAKFFALANGYVESYSIYAPELAKFAKETSNWLKSLKRQEAKTYIIIMRETLKEEGLRSTVLQQWIEAVVKSEHKVGWNEEVSNG